MFNLRRLSPLLRAARSGPVAAALLASTIPALEWCALACPVPLAMTAHLLGGMANILAVHCLIALPFTVIFLLFKGSRQSAVRLLGFIATYLLAFLPAIMCSELVRRRVFERFTRRAEPVVAAIRAYEAKEGCPPPSLEGLVPAYLPETPVTGFGIQREFRYARGKQAEALGGNPWKLSVPAPSGFMGFDFIVYLPLGNYSEQDFGGGQERIGEWVYVHE